MITSKKSYIIGETAYNHEGDIEYLKQMIDDIYELKLDAIKFHLLLEPNSYIVSDHPVAPYYEEWKFSINQWTEIFQYSMERNLDIIALCDDIESIRFVNSKFNNLCAIEIHSVSLNDVFMLKEAAKFKNTIILGIGGSSIDEIAYAIKTLNNNQKYDILLMYGFQVYPTDYKEINISKMIKLKQIFNLPIGYADHTAYNDENNVTISAIGAALGFNILEKHYTPSYGEERIDYHAAVGKDIMNQIIKMMELNFILYGNGYIGLSKSEQKYGEIGPMKKAIVAKKKIEKGQVITYDHLCFKRTKDKSFINQTSLNNFLGKVTKRDIEENEILDYSMITINNNSSVNFGLKE